MNSSFKNAVPVWETGKEYEMNSRLQFKAQVASLSDAKLKIATSGMYNLFINGAFVCYGPARAGKKHFRMDVIAISQYLSKPQNTVIIEVAGYNVNGFAVQNQPSFLQAEVVDGDSVAAFTGKDFTARKNPYYYRKMPRYSFQRPMAESYCYDNVNDTFFTDNAEGGVALCECEEKKIISRLAPYPEYKTFTAEAVSFGTFKQTAQNKTWGDRACNITDELLGFKNDELDVFPVQECCNMDFAPACLGVKTCLSANEYNVYKLPFEMTGFLSLRVKCKAETQIYILFDELLTDDNNVNFLRMSGVANAVRFDLCEGSHNLRLFEVYSMQCIQIAVAKGECEIDGVTLTEYKHPPVYIPSLKSPKLQKIADAAAETFCQNSVDLFMDCPSRERAGWLCDSFFTGRAEKRVAGCSVIEKSFLENFLHEESYEHLPDGMFPMCYPADFYDKNFLPQWALWLVLELKEYLQRSGDIDLINRFECKIHKLLAFFAQYENTDGLLESLPGWNFIEWSRANDFVTGVSYPTNMLYCAALRVAGELYGNDDYVAKSDRVKNEVLRQSFNGEFFVDNAERVDGELVVGTEISEVCQYYAFFMNVADKETHAELFNNLIRNFGPERKEPEKTAHIHVAAPFIGYMLRLDILENNGFYDELAQNIEDYYYFMAEKTGTLWEHAKSSASCCHGFGGYVLCWLDKLSAEGY